MPQRNSTTHRRRDAMLSPEDKRAVVSQIKALERDVNRAVKSQGLT